MTRLLILLLFFVCISINSFSQKTVETQLSTQKLNAEPKDLVKDDSLIKEQIVSLALNNPALKVADANIAIAKINLKKSKSTFLSTMSASANINEFVVNGSEASNFYPKYNFGLMMPMDIFARSKADKNAAVQNLNITNEQKKAKASEIRTAVLILYENYKEQKELVRIQKILMEPDLQLYLSAQKRYSDGEIQIEEVNLAYQTYVNQQAKLVSKERDLNVAELQLEELIGIPITDVFKKALVSK